MFNSNQLQILHTKLNQVLSSSAFIQIDKAPTPLFSNQSFNLNGKTIVSLTNCSKSDNILIVQDSITKKYYCIAGSASTLPTQELSRTVVLSRQTKPQRLLSGRTSSIVAILYSIENEESGNIEFWLKTEKLDLKVLEITNPNCPEIIDADNDFYLVESFDYTISDSPSSYGDPPLDYSFLNGTFNFVNGENELTGAAPIGKVTFSTTSSEGFKTLFANYKDRSFALEAGIPDPATISEPFNVVISIAQEGDIIPVPTECFREGGYEAYISGFGTSVFICVLSEWDGENWTQIDYIKVDRLGTITDLGDVGTARDWRKDIVSTTPYEEITPSNPCAAINFALNDGSLDKNFRYILDLSQIVEPNSETLKSTLENSAITDKIKAQLSTKTAKVVDSETCNVGPEKLSEIKIFPISKDNIKIEGISYIT